MPLTFCVGYVHKGEVIMSRKEVAHNYLLTWFIPDFLVVGLDISVKIAEALFSIDSSSSAFGRMFRILRISRTIRLLRLLKLKRILIVIQDQANSEFFPIMLDFCKLIA